MARRTSPKAPAKESASEWLAKLRAMPAGIQSVDVDDEPETIAALLTGRTDVETVQLIGDRDAQNRNRTC
jgi:hypothetical protein